MQNIHRFKTDKLVRDKMPDLLMHEGIHMETRSLDTDSHIFALKEKILEEAQEVLEAKEKNHQLEEVADVLEAIHSLSHALHGSLEIIDRLRRERHVASHNTSKDQETIKKDLVAKAKAVQHAIDRDVLGNALADLLGDVHNLGHALHTSMDDLEHLRREKHKKFGGYGGAIYCTRIEVPENNPRLKHFLSQPNQYQKID